MEYLDQSPVLTGPLLQASAVWAPGEAVQLVLGEMSTEEVMRTSDSPPSDYRLSVPYLARVVRIDGVALISSSASSGPRSSGRRTRGARLENRRSAEGWIRAYEDADESGVYVHDDDAQQAASAAAAGVLLAAPGRGDALSAYAAEHYPFFATIDFSTMTAPALVVAGDADPSTHLTTAGAPWHADPYRLAPGPKSLLTLFGAGHGLGGISAYDAAETTDENPERVAALARLAGAYLRSRLYPGDAAWTEATTALLGPTSTIGRVESR